MSADLMPCGCSYHFDYIDECEYPDLAKKYLALVKLASKADLGPDMEEHKEAAKKLEKIRYRWDHSE